MQAPQPKISGTRDFAGDDAVALQAARDAIAATLRSYAYAAIDPPILERSAPFLNRSGEDIRRHMYIFPDPGGREVCLRPELTIPVCRAYLRQLQSPDGPTQSPEREARLCYFGPAFRYESTSEGRYRQFYQAGAELIGAKHSEAADAEILAVALAALAAAGVNDALVEMGDVDIRNAFIDQLPIADRTRTRLRRLALTNRKPAPPNARAAAKDANATASANEFGELAALLAAAEPGKAELLLKDVLALADIRHVGGRTPEEIVERLASRNAQHAPEPVSAELLEGVAALLEIKAKPAAAFDAVRDHFRKFGIGPIDPVLERCESRLRYFDAYGQRQAKLEFNVGLQRGLEYYTGFLFEIVAAGAKQTGHICGGGRYDNLLEGLGANAPIPAVGFGIGLDRLLAALQKPGAHASQSIAPDAIVAAASKTRHEEYIRVATALRNTGWSVETDASGRSASEILRDAAKRQIPYVVFVGEDAAKKDQVRVRRRAEREDKLMTLSALVTLAKGGKP